MRLGHCLIVVVVMITGCGESTQERANREALIPLIHRNRALTDEYVRWVDRQAAGGVTWGQSHEQLQRFVTAKDSILSLVRQIVPTERYDCLIRLVARGIEADKGAISSRLNWSRQTLRANSALSLAKDNLADARTSYYAADVFRNAANRALSEVSDAVAQANSFRVAENRESLGAQMVADTLAATILAWELLPSNDRQRYPVVTDSGPDSLLQLTRVGPPAACQP